MAFDTQTVTIKGAELLAAATAQDKLIIVGCDVTHTYMTQAQAVNISARPANPFSNTTTVTQVGSNSNHINSRVYFRAGENTGGDANTLFLYAHKQSDPTNDFVIFVASAQTPFHLPVVGDVVDEWETALDIVYTINADAVGYAEQSTYCTLSEFNLLKERTVTTHKEGEPTTGDPLQNIYGVKAFHGAVGFSDDVNCTYDVYIDNTDGNASVRFIPNDEDGEPPIIVSAKHYVNDDTDNYTELEFTWENSSVIDNAINVHGSVISDRAIIGGKARGLYCKYYTDESNRSAFNIEFENSQTNSPQIALVEQGTDPQAVTYISITANEVDFNSENVSISGDLSVQGGSLDVGETNITTTTSQVQTITNITLPTSTGSANILNVLNARLDVIGGGITAEQNIHADGDIQAYGDIKADGNIQSSGTISVKDSNNRTKILLSESTIRTSADGTNPTFSIGVSDGSIVTNTTITCGELFVVGQFTGGVQQDGSIGVKDSNGNTIVSISAASLGSVSIGTATVGADMSNGGFSVRDTTRSQNAYMRPNEICIADTTKSVIISAKGIYGIAPQSGSTLNVPIGGIIGVFANAGELINTMSAGTLITVDNVNTGHIYACKWDSGSGAWAKDTAYYIPDGSYRSITGFTYNSTSTPGIVLLQRVA